MKKETTKITLSKALHVIKCSKCDAIIASASEKMYLPSFSTCDTCYPQIKTNDNGSI